MSGTPINLNRARKERTRDSSKKSADANALKFGRSKADRQADVAKMMKAREAHEAHRRGSGDAET